MDLKEGCEYQAIRAGLLLELYGKEFLEGDPGILLRLREEEERNTALWIEEQRAKGNEPLLP